MCDLCSTDPKEIESARKAQVILAERLERAAAFHRRLAFGTVTPHSNAAADHAVSVRGLIRDLVAGWL
jgi:hypothetical protein